MSISKIKNFFSKKRENVYLSLLRKGLKNKFSQPLLLKEIEKKVWSALVENTSEHLRKVQIKKFQWVRAVIRQLAKNYQKGIVSSKTIGRLIVLLGGNNFFREEVSEVRKAKEEFRKKYQIEPPLFIVVSPTQICNLRCKGCYAASSSQTAKTIPFDVFDRILKENHNIFGSRFVTISGGEPLLYQSQGKTLMDVFEKYNDTFFIFYTNGTLIDKKTAKKLAQTGNAIPQISVEGTEEETDQRRGKGVYKKVLEAVSNLREEGIPFVVSVTATRKNFQTLTSDEFYDFWFEKQGASHMWIFQLMPIGRGKEVFDLMPTPEERVKLYRKWEGLLEKGYPVADFWNSGVLSSGCIAYGRCGGYFYIDWNGNIMPCVFIPYYVDNVYELYQQGKTLADALFSDFFKRGREWQDKYGYACPKKAKNWLMPCSIRDHAGYFREVVLPENAKGEDVFAQEAKNSKEYWQRLEEYDRKLKELTQPIWDRKYKE